MGGQGLGVRKLPAGITNTLYGERVCALPSPRLSETDDPRTVELWWKPGGVMFCCPDYSVIYTARPSGPERTTFDVMWLVHEDAEEGRDYEREQVAAFFRATLDEDKQLCETLQPGLHMRPYAPGPLNRHYQAGGIGFYRWYEESMRRAGVAL